MIHTKTGSYRRILTFPAVQPCKSISVTTLLDSLIQLAGDILAFKEKHFSTNKRSFQKTIRQIQNLAIFLEEIRIRIKTPRRYFPHPAAVSSLSEIHVIFQKLKFLLEDSTRDGARIHMLMSSDQVSDHLRVLTLSISTSLSTFPVSSFDLPSEVNELIDLVVQQARKHVVRHDSDDKKVIASVDGVLALFESRVIPDPDEINRILDDVGIRTWGDCVKEINFLGEEIEAERLENNNKKKNNSNARVELLSGLIGFICYCRCVILRRIESDHHHHHHHHHRDDHVHDEELIRGLKAEDLLCPISLEIMTDPVVIETGHTYDRSSITKWFGSGNITCPKTGKILTSTELVDNVSVSHVIQKHCRANGVVLAINGRKRKSHGDVAPDSLAARGAGRLIARFLASELTNGGDEEAVYRALREIRVLTKTGSFNRSCLVEAGCVSPLLNLLTSEDSRVQESAMAGLLNLSKHVAGKSEIAGGEGVGLIVEILNGRAKTETRLYAASALFYLSSVEDYSLLIGENADAIPGLMKIVKGRDDEYGDSAKRTALLAVMGLLMQSENHWRVLAAGAVPALIDLLRDEETGGELAGDCLATLAKLAEYPDGTIGVIRRGGLKLAVKILSSSDVSTAVRQHCVALVLNLCLNAGSDVVGVLVKNSVVMGSLYTVISNGEYGGSKKASALIRMIHEYQERRTGSVEPSLQRGRFIHAW
ncbi:U-box domain-containing protein 18 [Raphanus sativus]|uniref:RING-type E3 ubiquitin transferase n=1 Tax=Raphanus sativus TaxID=3726 RepID=A0A6J0K186_RAPSA|nr:U-box domain-containing protein 18 [Raphanus sativus]XP_056852858.1 U-box domain-containing protein 18-like [Raphanus sativus]KAJ4872228.1 U-box domain-containing protein 18 [Raphanus sativus]KAJ4915511.1 U-box domain-containing protein 18 [Raphanus sativus]